MTGVPHSRAGSVAERRTEPLALCCNRTGTLADLEWKPARPRPPGPRDVRVEVQAIGLNLRDVLKALGMYPGTEREASALAFGGDIVGVVTACGAEVEHVTEGDCIVGHGPDTFATTVTVPAATVAPAPRSWRREEAATLPIAFLTASYALEHLAGLRAGETVLIHAATGGVGCAAVQLCQAIGAEVFATAGTPEKRMFLQENRVPHVMDSRTLDFAEQIMAETQGRGVDVVLNSLAGEFLIRSMGVLAPFGRFLEIGKRDVHADTPIGLSLFRNNASFFAIDLEQMPVERGTPLLCDLVDRANRGGIRPLPVQVFSLSEFRDAFRLMRRARHIGKVVLVAE